MSSIRRITAILLAIALVAALPPAAFAKLAAVGPINPANGFPLYFQDSNGVAVELPAPPIGDPDGLVTPTMTFDAVDPNNPFSVQIGFGTEAFYWIAAVNLDLPNGNRALVEFGLEAAFAAGPAADGDQFVFQRTRIRIDTPVAGTYKVIHPYGTATFPNVPAGRRAINSTEDIGGITPAFDRALTGPLGPFLVAVNPAPTAGWVGDGGATSTVTGSPTGFNKVRIEGPPNSNLGGPGINFIETDQFTVSGHIFPGTVPTPLLVDRATYSRTADGIAVDVFATSTPNARVEVFVSPARPPVPMTGDGSGRFFARVNFPPTFTLPGFVRVVANRGAPTATSINRNLVDFISVTDARYTVSTQTMAINGASSDAVTLPVLTVTGFGDLVGGALNVTPMLAPPAEVTVTSTKGGSDTVPLAIVP
ncbi:MAG: hypothetical protein WC443_10745 [Desulfobaccales bacterium]